jgi:hypothetical protein
VNVCAGQAGQLGGAQPGGDGDMKEGPVAPAGPGAGVGCGEQRGDLGLGQVADDRAVAAFGGNGQDAGDVAGVLGTAGGQVAEQGPDRGEPGVAGAGGAAPVPFEVVQEPGDRAGSDVADVEAGRRLPGLLPGVGEQQPPCVQVRRRWCAGWPASGG